MAKRLIWSIRAKRDLVAIFNFWDENNKSDYYSKKLAEGIHSILILVSENNFLGKQTTIPDIRITVCDNYLIFYKILKDAVLVISIFDGRRNPKEKPHK